MHQLYIWQLIHKMYFTRMYPKNLGKEIWPYLAISSLYIQRQTYINSHTKNLKVFVKSPLAEEERVRIQTYPALTVLMPNAELVPQSANEQQASQFVTHLGIQLLCHYAQRKAKCSLIKKQVVINYPHYSPQLTSPSM